VLVQLAFFLALVFGRFYLNKSFAMGRLNNIKNNITPSDVSGDSSADSDMASGSEGTVRNLVPGAMPSRPLPGSASHGEIGSSTEGVPPGSSTQQLPTLSECTRVTRSFASAHRTLVAQKVARAQAALRKRERSLERLNRKIRRLESEIENDEENENDK